MIIKTYESISLDKLDPVKTAKEVGELGIVLIKNSGSTPKEFSEWANEFGYHLPPNVWATDKEISPLFWRVTNQIIDGANKGLAGDHELDWHSNVTPVLDGEEIVGLYGKTFSYPTETWFCNSIPYWNQLPLVEKEKFRKLTVVLDPKRKLGRIQPSWSLNLKEIYSDEIIKDLVKNRETREIANALNMEPENKNNYKPSRGVLESAKFVPKHPLGTEGLFFSPNEIHGFYENETKRADSERIYWKIWQDLVLSEKYTYKHKWSPGDIILMDQVLTIHRRPNIHQEKARELLRIACWYKTSLRKHFDYVF